MPLPAAGMMIVLMGVVGWVTGDSLTMEGFDKITRFLGIMFPGQQAAFENNNDKKFHMRKCSNVKHRGSRPATKAVCRRPVRKCRRVLGLAQ